MDEKSSGDVAAQSAAMRGLLIGSALAGIMWAILMAGLVIAMVTRH